MVVFQGFGFSYLVPRKQTKKPKKNRRQKYYREWNVHILDENGIYDFHCPTSMLSRICWFYVFFPLNVSILSASYRKNLHVTSTQRLQYNTISVSLRLLSVTTYFVLHFFFSWCVVLIIGNVMKPAGVRHKVGTPGGIAGPELKQFPYINFWHIRLFFSIDLFQLSDFLRFLPEIGIRNCRIISPHFNHFTALIGSCLE